MFLVPKALFVLEIFTFLSWLFGNLEKRLDKKAIMLISKFMTSKTGQQIIAIQLLPHISRSKGNQAMKCGQLIEQNVRKILCYILLSDQISLSGCLYFLRYWAIYIDSTYIVIICCQFVTSIIAFLSSRFSTKPKSWDKNVNI